MFFIKKPLTIREKRPKFNFYIVWLGIPKLLLKSFLFERCSKVVIV